MFFTKSQRNDVIECMKAEVENCCSSTKIAAKVVNAFSSIFVNRLNCTIVRRTHREKAQSWWNGHDFLFLSSILNLTQDFMLPLRCQKGL